MKHSLRRQFAGIFIGLMAGTILLCWFLNNTFLEKYYIWNKQDALLDTYSELQKAAIAGEMDTEAVGLRLQQNCDRYNLSYLVVDADSKTIRASRNDTGFIKQQLLRHVFMQSDETISIMEQTGQYVVQRVADVQSRMEYIEMWGILDNSNFFIIRTALEGIQDSVDIANRFLAYVGIVAAVASGLIIWYVSRKVTEPVLQLAKISERMTHLDFDARYCGDSKNEIALLGDNINQLSEALEKTVSELKTANNELKKDIERKNRVDEMRREFLANVSHELKTPIALIQGYAEGLQEGIGEDAESRAFYCNVIVDEAVRMNQMVKKLLTLNQMEFGNETVVMERFDVAALVEECLQSSKLLAAQNGIELRYAKMLPLYVWGDEFQTEEVFTNYFSNAVNHCERERIIEIKLERREKTVRLSVFNTGAPIPEEALPHIWEKFYKVDKARTREYGGSGLGLSIVRAAMEAMGQQFGVKNYENGVEFWFELECVSEQNGNSI